MALLGSGQGLAGTNKGAMALARYLVLIAENMNTTGLKLKFVYWASFGNPPLVMEILRIVLLLEMEKELGAARGTFVLYF